LSQEMNLVQVSPGIVCEQRLLLNWLE